MGAQMSAQRGVTIALRLNFLGEPTGSFGDLEE